MGFFDIDSQFEKIPISPERKQRMIDQQINEISYAIEEAKSQNGEKWTVKQMEAQKKKLEEPRDLFKDEQCIRNKFHRSKEGKRTSYLYQCQDTDRMRNARFFCDSNSI